MSGQAPNAPKDLLCPSAQPDMADARVLGVIDRGSGRPRLGYVNARAPVTPDLLEAAGPAPLAILRIAARCETGRCAHFDGEACSLAARIVDSLEVASDALPPCAIRRDCRWHNEQGNAACLRCAQVVTLANRNDAEPALLAGPDARHPAAQRGHAKG